MYPAYWFKVVVFDDFTHHMTNTMHNEVEDQHFVQKKSEAEKDGKKLTAKVLTAMVKTNIENHGSVNSWTKRIFRAMGNRSKEGKTCIIIAHDDERPKRGTMETCPNFSGKQINKEFMGMFGMIGRVVERFEVDDKGNIVRDRNGFPNKVYPPYVYFKSDGTFIARGGGIGQLDFGKILGVKKGK
jgi:hypothetical protein